MQRKETIAVRLLVVLIAASALGTGCSHKGDAGPSKPSFSSVTVDPNPPVMMRLTSDQYTNAVKDVLGKDIAVPKTLEPDVRDAGSLILGAAKTTISPRGVELYEDAATQISSQALDADHRKALAGCKPSGTTDDGCAKKFIEAVGRRLWRRPLNDTETSRLVKIANTSAKTLNDFWGGLQYALSAMLQSPKFLFRTEVGQKDGNGGRELTPWELATRLSFFFWNTTPDDTLLDAAANGGLDTKKGIDAQIDRLVADDRAHQGVRRFFTDLYDLDKLDDIIKAPEIYEHAGEDVGPSAREQTLRTIEWLVFDQHEDFRDFLTTRTTFVNRKLASIYDIRAPKRDGFGKVEFPEDSPRVGFLGQVSFLALQAHPTTTSPTRRGKFIREKLLCQPMPNPPAGVDTSIPEPSKQAPTLRARLESHATNPSCSVCHKMMDPIGLGFENFDGIGGYRQYENDTKIDASGDLDGTSFENAKQLAELLRDDDAFPACVTQKLYSYATGHVATSGERDLVDLLNERWKDEGYDFLSLMRDVAESPGFREVAAAQGGQ